MSNMATKRPSLSRGLGALLGQPSAPVSPATAAVVTALRPMDEELQKLPVDLLQRGKYQPRRDMLFLTAGAMGAVGAGGIRMALHRLAEPGGGYAGARDGGS